MGTETPIADSQFEARLSAYLQDLEEFCRIPSVASDDAAVREMAALVEQRLRRAGFDVISDSAEGGHQTFIARMDGDSAGHLLFFNHYDVDPAGPEDAWDSPPFEVTKKGELVYGRGVADNKGTLLARLHAIEALLDRNGTVPCSVTFLIEAKRSMYGPHLGAVVERHKDRLAADACLWENSTASEDGRPTLRLGDKGMLMVRIRSTGTKSNLSSQYASIFPSASWTLVSFLSRIRAASGEIALPDFYAHVRSFSAEEETIFRQAPVKQATLEALGGIKLEGEFGDSLIRYYTGPTANIARLSAGAGAEVMMSVNPSEAVADMDFRLVPDQDADEVYARLVETAAEFGGAVTVERIGSMPPARTPVSHPFVSMVRDVARSVYGKDALLEPLSPTVGSRSVLSWSGMPIVGHGVAYAGSNIQAANEHVRLEHVTQGMEFVAAVIQRTGEMHAELH